MNPSKIADRFLDRDAARRIAERHAATTGVKEVVSVSADFQSVDEWHSTTVVVKLSLGAAKLPESAIKEWVRANWLSITQKLQSVKPPPPAEAPQRYRDYDRYDDEDGYGDDESTDWMQDYPEEGLGWVSPSRMRWSDVEQIDITQRGNRTAEVHLNASVR